MSDYCNICDTRRPQGGTNLLILNEGDLWLEYCKECGESEKLTNPETGEVKTISELARLATKEDPDTCEFCESEDMSASSGLCHICAEDHYA